MCAPARSSPERARGLRWYAEEVSSWVPTSSAPDRADFPHPATSCCSDWRAGSYRWGCWDSPPGHIHLPPERRRGCRTEGCLPPRHTSASMPFSSLCHSFGARPVDWDSRLEMLIACVHSSSSARTTRHSYSGRNVSSAERNPADSHCQIRRRAGRANGQ